MHLKKIIVLALALTFVAAGAFAQKVSEPKVKAGNATISKAEITAVGPLNVLPGTLVAVEGKGFGTAPTAIKVGAQTITEFVTWEDTCVFFRLPAAVQNGDVVMIGNASADAEKYSFKPAPADSIVVQWIVDVSKVTTNSLAADKKALTTTKINTVEVEKVNALPADQQKKFQGMPKFSAPLWVKGEWIKSGNDYGKREPSWDGGSKIRMANAGNNMWIAEAVFTPDNTKSYQFSATNTNLKPLKFAFEDSNLVRNLVEFESDWAFSLKKDFAVTDTLTTLHSDPGIDQLTVKSKWYDAGSKKIYAVYPVTIK